jgi:hypothetical protein
MKDKFEKIASEISDMETPLYEAGTLRWRFA